MTYACSASEFLKAALFISDCIIIIMLLSSSLVAQDFVIN